MCLGYFLWWLSFVDHTLHHLFIHTVINLPSHPTSVPFHIYTDSILKSHYRLGATWRNDCCEDCLAPTTVYCCTHSVPPITWFLSAFYFTRFATMMAWEVKGRKQKQHNNDDKHHNLTESTTITSNKRWVVSRPGDSERRYLAGYSPPKEEEEYYNIGMSSTVQTHEPLRPSSTIV